MNLGGSTQTIDTICLPTAQAKKVLTDAKQKRVLEGRVKLLEDDINTLTQRIDNYEGQIKELRELNRLGADIEKLLREQIEVMKSQRADLERQIAALKKSEKKWRAKTRLTAIVGGIAVAGILILK